MHREYWLRGLILSIILFLVGNLLNLSISYMGNESSDVSSVMIKLFWPSILYQILKVFLCTVLVGVIFNGFYALFINFMREKTGKELSGKWISAGIIISILFYFLATVIHVPQLFIDSFFSKASFLPGLLYWLTDNLSSTFFYVIFYIINIPVFAIGVISLGEKVYGSVLFSRLNLSVKKRVPFLNRRLASVFIIFLSLIILLSLAFSPENHGRKNIIIISSDSIRPDRISANGYSRKTTPNLDEYMKNSLQLRGVMTTVPRTFPAWVSLLTSSTPLHHDIGHMFPRTRERSVQLESAVTYLRGKGYYTSVISEFAGDIFPRVDLGFDTVKAPDMNFKVIIRQIILERQVFLMPFVLTKAGRFLFPELRDLAKFSDPKMLTNECIDEIEKSGDKPFFISIFYSITHFPFSGNYPYYNKFSDPDYKGPYKYLKQIVVSLGKGKGNKKNEVPRENRIKDEKQVNALYDGCLNQLDFEIGRIVEYLKERGLYDDTMIIVTSDHGENLYDFSDYGIGHGEHLRGYYANEIPFIMMGGYIKEDDRGKTINTIGSIIDILPTAFDYVGLGVPNFFRGRDVLFPSKEKVRAYAETGIWFDNNKASDLFFYHERIDYPDISGLLEVDFNYRNEGVVKEEYQNVIKTAKHRTIYTDRYKLIYVPLSSGVKFELYDFIRDPENRKDLSRKKPGVLRNMKKLFYDYVMKESDGNYKRVGDYILPFYSDSVF